MSIGAPNGILDITNAIVRVSKMEFQQATGFDTVFNNIARNTILLTDSATYETATTYHNWALKLPNAWVLDADVYLDPGTVGDGDHTLQLNFYNNTNTTAINGYTLGLDGTSITLSYDGTQLDTATLSTTINTGTWHKLFVIFEKDTIAVAIDGKFEYAFTDSELRARIYNEDTGYVVFYHEAGVARKIKNIKFVNGDKWSRVDGTSNIAYLGGSVGIGTRTPAYTLDVTGDVNVSNVLRLESFAIGSKYDLDSVTSVGGMSTYAIDITNTTASTSKSTGALKVAGGLGVAGNVYTDSLNVSSNLVVGTANLFVDTTTGNVGVGTSTPTQALDVSGNVQIGTANLFVDTTTGNVGVGTSTPAYTLDVDGDINLSGSLYQGASPFISSLWTDGESSLYYRSNVEVGTANLFVDTTTGNTGIGTTTPAQTLEVSGTMRVSNVTDFNTRADMYVYQVDNPWIYDPKFENPNPLVNDGFGNSVSMSSDGYTFVVGAKLDNTPGTDAGTARVYMWDGVSTWNSAVLTHPSPSVSDYFGHSVAISGDGNTVIVGASQDTVTISGQGSAWIFRRSGLVWTRETNPLVNSIPVTSTYLGNSVSLSSDGNTAIVGGFGLDTGAGSAWIFTYSGGTWTQLPKLTISGLVANENFGHSVAISGDGNTAIVGAYKKDSSLGASYIFRWNGSTWSEEAKLVAPSRTVSTYFGYSVAISPDGNMVIVGSIGHSPGLTNAGGAWIYKYTDGSWDGGTELIQPNRAAQDNFGWSVAMSSDENTIAVGAPYKDLGGVVDIGSVYIFRWNSDTTSWEAETNPIAYTSSTSGAEFGSSIGLASDGSIMVVGMPGDTASSQSKAGSVSVWRKPDPTDTLNISTPINVNGDINFSGNVYQDASPFISSLWIDGDSSLYYRSNVEVGTANLFVDTNTGRVGIGKTSPSYNLDVVGTANISSDLKAGTSSFYVNTSTSSVGIGKTNPSYNLDVVGTIYASGNITAFSDARFKENIEPIDKALEKICSIGGYTYNKIGETRRDTGVIAQELKGILPEAVHGTEDMGYSVAYGNLVGILIEAIKELDCKVKNLENNIN